MQKEYLKGWWEMISRKHGISASNILWMISLFLWLLTIFGIIASQGVWKTASWIVFGIILCLYFWHLFIQIPAEMFHEVKKESKELVDLRTLQKRLLQQQPDSYVQILIKRITLFQHSVEHTNWAEIELYIFNGSIFPIDFSIECGKSELTTRLTSFGKLNALPFVSRKGPERLEAGKLQTSTIIQQDLKGDIAEAVYNADKAIYSQWKLNLTLKYEIDGITKSWEFTPQWDGVFDRKYGGG